MVGPGSGGEDTAGQSGAHCVAHPESRTHSNTLTTSQSDALPPMLTYTQQPSCRLTFISQMLVSPLSTPYPGVRGPRRADLGAGCPRLTTHLRHGSGFREEGLSSDIALDVLQSHFLPHVLSLQHVCVGERGERGRTLSAPGESMSRLSWQLWEG